MSCNCDPATPPAAQNLSEVGTWRTPQNKTVVRTTADYVMHHTDQEVDAAAATTTTVTLTGRPAPGQEQTVIAVGAATNVVAGGNTTARPAQFSIIGQAGGPPAFVTVGLGLKRTFTASVDPITGNVVWY